MIVFWLIEHIFKLTSSPKIELHHAAASKLLSKLVVRGFGEMRRCHKDVTVRGTIGFNPISNNGFDLFGAKRFFALALNHPKVAVHRMRHFLLSFLINRYY